MNVDTASERERLSQAKLLAWTNRDMPATEMVSVRWSHRNADHDYGIYCALIPTARIEESLGDPCWDLTHGRGLPEATQFSNDDGNAGTEYLRYGDWHVEPLVIDREFHGMRSNYSEISEEFRLFHRLYDDRGQNHFIKFDDDGNETLVATIEPNRVQVRLKELRQFLAIKEMHLAIQFDCREHSTLSLENLGLKEGGNDSRDGLLCWGLNYGDGRGSASYQSFSRLLGKRLIPPLPKEKSGFWPYAVEEPKQHVEFIIGVNEDGDEILNSSNPDRLSNYFGANPGEPHYLTAVFFHRMVLDKYYQQTSKFSVEDSYVRCGSLWGVTMDNHHDDKVAAWLGDLGRDLPYQEQLHWRSFNIPPTGPMSDVFLRRQIDAEFADSEQPDIEFQHHFRDLRGLCNKRLGWSIFDSLDAKDEHNLTSLRIPASNEQKEFDELVLSLAKVLVDSLNEKELMKLIPPHEHKGLTGSISRLERVFATREDTRYETHIQFLRDLQELRSTGTAHRKGRKYEKVAARFTTDTAQLPRVFRGMLVEALNFVAYLRDGVRAGLFDGLGHKNDGS